jgi:hypothetical protein
MIGNDQTIDTALDCELGILCCFYSFQNNFHLREPDQALKGLPRSISLASAGRNSELFVKRPRPRDKGSRAIGVTRFAIAGIAAK